MTTSRSPRTVRLYASELRQISLEDAARLLGSEAATWLGEPTVDSPSGLRRFATDLRLQPNDRGLLATIHKAAYIDLGRSRRVGDALLVAISWRSATLAPLFPVFAGWLTVRPGELHIDGYYAPPGGTIGLIADRALLHLAARGTARWLLRQLARAAAQSNPHLQTKPADSRLDPSQPT